MVIGLFFFPILIITISLFGFIYPFYALLRKFYVNALDDRGGPQKTKGKQVGITCLSPLNLSPDIIL